VEEDLEKQGRVRQPQWTESIAIGTEAFVRNTKEKLGIRATGREVIRGTESYELREPETPYKPDFSYENEGLKQENRYFWDLFL
jgi:hypothetical protein